MAFGNLPPGNFELMGRRTMGQEPGWMQADEAENPTLMADEWDYDGWEGDDPELGAAVPEMGLEEPGMGGGMSGMDPGLVGAQMEDAGVTSPAQAMPPEMLPSEEGMPEPAGFPTAQDPNTMDEPALDETLKSMLEARQKQRQERSILFQRRAEEFNKYGK